MSVVFCRLCECPVVDGGVQASEVDKEKFDEWCVNFLGAELADKLKEGDVICNSCVCNAKMILQSDEEDCDHDDRFKWWSNSGDEQGNLNSQCRAENVEPRQELLEVENAEEREQAEEVPMTSAKQKKKKVEQKKKQGGKKKGKKRVTRDTNLSQFASILATVKLDRDEVFRHMWSTIKQKNSLDSKN